MGFLFGLLVDAAIIGIVIAAVERDEFPGWGPAIAAVLTISLTTGGVGALLPDALWFLAVLAGAVVGAFVISWGCHMPLRRGALAAGAYFAVKIVLGFFFGLLLL